MKTQFSFRKYGLMGISLLFFALSLSGQSAPSTTVVDLLDTINNTPDVFYTGSDQHVHILYFDGAWHHTDVTAAAGAPNTAVGSSLADLLDTIYGTPDVFYIGANQHVYILYFNGTWNVTDVTSAAGAPNAAVGSPLAGLMDTIYGTPDVFYIGANQHVYILYFNGTWNVTDVTSAAGAPNAAVGSPLADLLDIIYGTPDVFYIGANQHVYILYFNGTWNVTDVTSAAGAPLATAGSPLADLLDTIYGTPDVFYLSSTLGTDQHVHLLSFNGIWNEDDVTAAAGAPNAAVGPLSPLAALLDTTYSTPDVFYVGALDQHVHILYFDGAWHHTDVTAAAGAPNPSVGSPLADLMDTIYGTPDVFYIGANQHVYILYFNGTWNVTDVTSAAGAPPV